MARRYSRDNRGRFAPTGSGATARGGRLRTAAGNKRATVTAKVAGGSRVGTMKGKVKRDTGAMSKVGRQPAKPAAKLPREQRLARATATASRIAKKRGQAANEAGAAFAERRRISGRASSKARSSAFAKEAAAGKQSASALRSLQRADNRESNLRAALGKERQAARTAIPKATAKPKTGQEIMKAEVRKVQNKKLRDINAEIKAAGPNAINLRVEKLALQNNMLATQPKQTAKQVAKSEKQTQVVRGRIVEMRRQNARIARAQANVTRNTDVRNSAASMSKASFARKPSKKTLRSQLRADSALEFYANPAKALKGVNKKKPGFRLPRNMR